MSERPGDYIRRAIKEGDMLPNLPNLESREHVKQRALIIAPRYKEFGQTYQPLSSTSTDAEIMHRFLVSLGYERANIRVLCDAYGNFYGRADPTRKNILDSLEWLVSGTQPGDYRFLHFSGHGDRCRSDPLTGKETRVVKTGPEERVPGDYELDNTGLCRRKDIQIVPIEELLYYNEVLITRVVEQRDDEEEEDRCAEVRDSELNECLSKLPHDSTITCVMDCCASGRILNLDYKYYGAGFRGGSNAAVATSGPVPGPIIPNYIQELTSEKVIKNLSSLMSSLTEVLPRRIIGLTGLGPNRINMEEAIPERERQMNQIQARIFAWSACHQRHWAFETFDGGLLTEAFTRQYKGLSRCTYNKLFEAVSRDVAEHRSGAPVPQFVQLWTSSNGRDGNSLASQLDLEVVI